MKDTRKATPFQELLRLKPESALRFVCGEGQLALCTDMGGRVFAELAGQSMHRIDLACVANPDRPFNNFGGGMLWPAPEGGPLGFNYHDDVWYVQPSINREPFGVLAADGRSATIEKRIRLVNRAGVGLQTVMRRQFTPLPTLPAFLADRSLAHAISYQTVDSFTLITDVNHAQALIGAWTLEQFDATSHTITICRVDRPITAINFDYYEYPGDRIRYHARGFTYRTDGQARQQIGIRAAARASWIGFYDLSRLLVCIRQNCSPSGGRFFNIADNDQPRGPFSAADNYSIFNSDESIRAFELETIGPVQTDGDRLLGSEVVSSTTFARFNDVKSLRDFLAAQLGRNSNGLIV